MPVADGVAVGKAVGVVVTVREPVVLLLTVLEAAGVSDWLGDR